MTEHPYIRAYLAGIAVPTAFLLVILTVFVTAHGAGVLPASVGRLVIVPMAAVPNLWGVWNVLYVALRRRRVSWPIGLHGALLPFLLLSLGLLLTRALEIDLYRARLVFTAFPFVLL